MSKKLLLFYATFCLIYSYGVINYLFNKKIVFSQNRLYEVLSKLMFFTQWNYVRIIRVLRLCVSHYSHLLIKIKQLFLCITGITSNLLFIIYD